MKNDFHFQKSINIKNELLINLIGLHGESSINVVIDMLLFDFREDFKNNLKII